MPGQAHQHRGVPVGLEAASILSSSSAGSHRSACSEATIRRTTRAAKASPCTLACWASAAAGTPTSCAFQPRDQPVVADLLQRGGRGESAEQGQRALGLADVQRGFQRGEELGELLAQPIHVAGVVRSRTRSRGLGWAHLPRVARRRRGRPVEGELKALVAELRPRQASGEEVT